MEQLRERLPIRAPRLAAAALLLATFLALTQLAAARASIALVTADYGANPDLRDRKSVGAHFHPDLAGPARFVAAEHRPGDVVIVMDILGHYAHSPHADYQLTLFDKRDAEGWLGRESLTDASELSAALERHRGQRVWIVLSATHLLWFEGDSRMAAVLDSITERAGAPVYRGRDGLSDVYRVEPGS